MFTGIVAAIGEIERVEPLGEQAGVRLYLAPGKLDLSDVAQGDSIAIQGACMTVVSLQDGGFAVDVSQESLRRTVGLGAAGPVNLEKAMRLSDRIGGHLVSGHVDGMGVVRRFEPVGESHLLEILAPAELARYLVYKGSITVNGVSLTVNRVEDLPVAEVLEPAWGIAAQAVLAGQEPRLTQSPGAVRSPRAEQALPAGQACECCAFQANLIPHTVAVTTLKQLVPGALVNLEIDQVARYLSRMHEVDARQHTGSLAAWAGRGIEDDKA
ncbi:MAG: riboflavin synthase [Lautropia sp.]|nr:riboflavin synthase [Lautropia sp.]